MTATRVEDPQDGRTPAAALAELRAGNRRFAAGLRLDQPGVPAPAGPDAVIFGCAEPQPAAETIFDRDELVVVRSAGHALGPAVLASIEYAVYLQGTPLVVVLGHDPCRLCRPVEAPAGRRARLDGHPGVVRASGGGGGGRGVDAHVRRTVDLLLARSATLAAAVSDGRCAVVGMTYRPDRRVRLVRPAPRTARIPHARHAPPTRPVAR